MKRVITMRYGSQNDDTVHQQQLTWASGNRHYYAIAFIGEGGELRIMIPPNWKQFKFPKYTRERSFIDLVFKLVQNRKEHGCS